MCLLYRCCYGLTVKSTVLTKNPFPHPCTYTPLPAHMQQIVTSWNPPAMRDDAVLILLTLVIKTSLLHEHSSFIKHRSLYLSVSHTRIHSHTGRKIRAMRCPKCSSAVQLQTESVLNIQASFNCLLAL